MAEGDTFLGFLKDTINSVPIVGAYSYAAWGPGNYNPNPAPAPTDQAPMDYVGQVVNAIPFAHVAGVATGAAADNVAPLKWALDFGNRTTDSFFGALAYGDYKNDASPSTLLEGWNLAQDSWGKPGHLSAGQIIGATVNEQFGGTKGPLIRNMNPFSDQSVATISAMSRRDWYGNIAGGVVDLTAAAVTPLGPLGVGVKVAREAGALTTLARVESADAAFAAAAKAGRLDKLSPRRGESFMNALNGQPASGEAYAYRVVDLAKKTLDHSESMSSSRNFLDPLMQNATEDAKRLVAETAHYARNLGPDLGTEAVGNAWLAVMGSKDARLRLIDQAPLIADKIANATSAPEVLGITAKAQSLMLNAHLTGGDYRLEKIVQDTFETPKMQARADAISAALDQAKLDAEQAHSFRQRIMALKPQFRQKVDGKYVDNFDTARLKEARGNAEAQFKSLSDQLKTAQADLAGTQRWASAADKAATSKAAMKDAGAAADSAAGRNAVSAFGPYKDATEFQKALGAAEQKVADLKAAVSQAKADRDLLAQTPLNDPQAMAKWQADLSSARANASQAVKRRDLLAAMGRVTRQAIREDAATARAIRPSLSATNLWLKDVMETGKSDAAVLNVRPTLLSKAQTAYHDYIGKTYMFETGDYSSRTFLHIHPKEQLAAIGTAYGRSAVNVNDVYRGKQELGMFLRKSGAYTGEEIAKAVEEFTSAAPNQKALIVSKYNDLTLERMLTKAGLSLDQINGIIGDVRRNSVAVRSYLTGQLSKADDAGKMWVKTNEFPAGQDVSTANHMIDAPTLRSHLADTVPFTDPYHIHNMIRDITDGRISIARAGRVMAGGVDNFNYYWKMFNLLRPGLFMRNMLDTGIRAGMLMGAADTLASSIIGSRNLVHNLGIRVGDWSLKANPMRGTALQREGARLGADRLAEWTLGDSGVKIKAGGGETRTLSFYDLQDGHATAASKAALAGAMTRGASYGEGLLGSATPLHNRMLKNLAKWDKYKATDIRWPEAYREHAQALLASPTAQKMIKQHTIYDDAATITGPQRIKDLFSDPRVRDEYNKLANDLNMTREQFVEQLDWEMQNMFPEPGMAEAVLSGKLKGKAGDKWIEDHFPPELRFDVPGYESVLPHHAAEGERFSDFSRGLVDKFFKTVMDKPDLMLVRHPVAVSAFKKQVKVEAETLLKARRKKFGENATLSADDIRKIDSRARTYAISQVRKYMYDSTYSTEFSQAVHRVAPFFNPWFDAMRAYSKLVYDDPNRLGVLSALWNAPSNLSLHLPTPLVVDINGQEVRPGQEPAQGGGERFFVLSSLLGGRKPFGIDLKLRQSAFNTILMGNTPWLPGWGPTVAVPLAPAINSNEDVALWLSKSDNLFVKTLMESLWPGGQVPRNDQVWTSVIPPTWRKIANLTSGDGYWQNVQFSMNAKYLRSIQTGEAFNEQRAYEEAQREAMNAGIIAGISQGVFGISAQADVQGQFYANEMHAIQAIPIDQVRAQGYPSHQAMFSAMFPEAANLTWTFTRNETGLNATIKAEDRATKLKSLIDKSPSLGWFIVGADNVGGDFSQTAYNQQRMNVYGAEQAGRKRLDSGEQMKQTLASFGWDQFLKFTDRLERLTTQYGLPSAGVARVKAAYAQELAKTNPTWWADYNDRPKKLAVFYNNADLIAQDPRMAGRQDIGMYVEYRAMRQQILDAFGLKTLDGTSRNSALARQALNTIGSRLAAQNIGFQQMWERMMSREVQPMATDVRFTNAV